jgi:hypothetical protein
MVPWRVLADDLGSEKKEMGEIIRMWWLWWLSENNERKSWRWFVNVVHIVGMNC